MGITAARARIVELTNGHAEGFAPMHAEQIGNSSGSHASAYGCVGFDASSQHSAEEVDIFGNSRNGQNRLCTNRVCNEGSSSGMVLERHSDSDGASAIASVEEVQWNASANKWNGWHWQQTWRSEQC